ncbi:MAGE-like protein 2 [Myotis daubentonii]|uniref:MAGE-like protein 2 n=1 Tax=Myotis daubentonii TaxID=98922 RepID=UPI00287305B3|nr:MAGE-like protein 2 [Myotis daubentonii]
MSHKSPSGHQSNQADVLTEDPESDTQDETSDPLPNTSRLSAQDPPPILHPSPVSVQEPPSVTHSRRVSIQEPPPVTHSRRVSTQEPPPLTHSRRVSIQEPPPILHTRRVSIQEHPPTVHTRRVSIQEPPPILHTRRVSIQEHPPTVHTRRVSIQEHPPVIQETLPVIHTRRVSIQEPSPILRTRRASVQEPSSILRTRRASVQEPSSILRTRRASVQEPSPIDESLWGSIREAPSLGNISQRSIQETPSTVNISQMSIQETPSVSSVHQAGPQDTAPVTPLNTLTVPPSGQTSFQIRRFSIPRPSPVPHIPLACIESVAYTSQTSLEDTLTSTQSQSLRVPGIKFPNRASVDVPPSITESPEASMESMEQILWTSQEDFKESLYNLQLSKNTPDSDVQSTPLHSSTDTSSSRFHFLHELREFLVHPGTPGHLDLGHGNGPPSFLLPQLPATGLTTLLSGPHTRQDSCPFSVPSESPPLKLLIGIFKSVLWPRICFWLSTLSVFCGTVIPPEVVPWALWGRRMGLKGRSEGRES